MILYYVSIALSALISIIGLIKYRGLIFGVFCQSKYQAGNIHIRPDQHFLI